MIKRYMVEVEMTKTYRATFEYHDRENHENPTTNAHLMGRISEFVRDNERGIDWCPQGHTSKYFPIKIEPVLDRTPIHGTKPAPEELQNKVDDLFKKRG